MGTITLLTIFATIIAIGSSQTRNRYSDQDAIGVPQGAVYAGVGPAQRQRPRYRNDPPPSRNVDDSSGSSEQETPVQRLRRPIQRRLLRPKPAAAPTNAASPSQGSPVPSRALPRRPVIPGAIPGAVPFQPTDRQFTLPERAQLQSSPQAIKPVVEDEYDDEEELPQQDALITPNIPANIPIPQAIPFRPETTIGVLPAPQPSYAPAPSLPAIPVRANPPPQSLSRPQPQPVSRPQPQPQPQSQPQTFSRTQQPARSSRPQTLLKKVPAGYDDDFRGSSSPRQQQQQQQQAQRSQQRPQVRQPAPRPDDFAYEKPQRPKKPVAQIIKRYRYDNDDGSITWGFENDDGTFKEETIGVDCVVRGKYGYVDPDGVKREYTYISGNPCDKKKEEEEQRDEGYIDYERNQYVYPNGDAIDLQTVVKNRARRPVGK